MAALRTTLGARFSRLEKADSPANETILSRTNACKPSRQMLLLAWSLQKPWQRCTEAIDPHQSQLAHCILREIKARKRHLQGLCSLSTSILWKRLLHSHSHAALASRVSITHSFW